MASSFRPSHLRPGWSSSTLFRRKRTLHGKWGTMTRWIDVLFPSCLVEQAKRVSWTMYSYIEPSNVFQWIFSYCAGASYCRNVWMVSSFHLQSVMDTVLYHIHVFSSLQYIEESRITSLNNYSRSYSDFRDGLSISIMDYANFVICTDLRFDFYSSSP